LSEPSEFRIVPATERDIPLVLHWVRALADYERLADTVEATEDTLRQTLFGPRPSAEVVLAYAGDEPAGFAVYFHTYSTFLGRAGMYLEDLFVDARWRGLGLGKKLLAYVAGVAVSRGCTRLEWAALQWNEPAIGFYRNLAARQMNDWSTFRLSDDALKQLASEAR
jgi:GNAT superfamily N-acetyltransferase